MKSLVMAADHAGFALKETLKKFLTVHGWRVDDLSPTLVTGDDYPPIAKRAAKKVVATDGRAILVCGSGYGMDIAANRIKGARAAVARTVKDAVSSRRDDLTNILVLGSRMTKLSLAAKIVSAWLATPVGKAKRFARRVKEIDVG